MLCYYLLWRIPLTTIITDASTFVLCGGGYPISPPSLCLLQIIRILHRTYLSLSLLGKFQAYHLYLYPYKNVCDSFAYFFVFKLCLFLNFMSPRPTMLVHSHWGGVSHFSQLYNIPSEGLCRNLPHSSLACRHVLFPVQHCQCHCVCVCVCPAWYPWTGVAGWMLSHLLL